MMRSGSRREKHSQGARPTTGMTHIALQESSNP
jgi:hypothetical protein